MRVLFLTNFYPPHSFGGEEFSCQQVVDGLGRRGHDVYVLTSMYATGNKPMEEGIVSRSLYLEMDFVPWRNSLLLLTGRKARERYNLLRLQQVFEEFQPDVIFMWGMWNLPRSVPTLVEELYPERAVYRFATYWPALPSQYELYWQAPGRIPLTRLLRRIIRPAALALAPRNRNQPPLQFKHIICVSEAVKKELHAVGVDVSMARVIYTGLDAQQYLNGADKNEPPAEGPSLSLLYAGRLQPEKGVHNLIQAIDELVHRRGLAGKVSLSVAGSGDPDYESKLHTMTRAMGLADHVAFLGLVPKQEMPSLYRAHDVLVLPSLWPEPFARVILEGMACGLAIVATREGGTGEIILDGENGLMFTAGDVHDLADRIVMLHQDQAMRAAIGAAARQTIIQKFTEQATLDAMENYLLEVKEER